MCYTMNTKPNLTKYFSLNLKHNIILCLYYYVSNKCKYQVSNINSYYYCLGK